MAMKAKAAAALVGITVLFGVGLAAAAGKKKSPATTGDDGLDDGEDSTESDNDIEVVTPGDDGSTGTGPALVMDADEAEEEADEAGPGPDVAIDTPAPSPESPSPMTPGSFPVEEVFPEEEAPMPGKDGAGMTPEWLREDATGGTPIDKKAQDLASGSNTTTNEVINEVVDTVTNGQNAAPLAAVETSPEMDPDGTVSLARVMLAREGMPNWKSDKLGGDIQEWQAGVGLVADGLFGIKSAARMAEEVGFLPLIRYWSKGIVSRKQAEAQYDAAIAVTIGKLKADLPDSQAQIDALTASMNREVAVAYGNDNPPPQKTLDFVQDVNDAIAESAELKGEKELKA